MRIHIDSAYLADVAGKTTYIVDPEYTQDVILIQGESRDIHQRANLLIVVKCTKML